MFEKSLILSTGTNRPWTVVVGFSGQMLAIGAAVLVPLVYTEKLPRFNLTDLHIAPPISRPEPPPPTPRTQPSHPVATSSTAHIFTAPISIPQRVNIFNDPPEILTTESSSLPFISGAPTSRSDGDGIPAVFSGITPPPPPPPVVKPTTRGPAIERIKQGGQVQEARIIRRVIPIYPQIAIQTRVSGRVELLGVIGRDGTVQQLKVISGHPLLIKAAMDAVLQWTYRPTLLNGEPVEVIAPIDVNFTLNR